MTDTDLTALLYNLERWRLWGTIIITILGLFIAVGVIFILLRVDEIDAQGISTVVDLFTTVLGTIVGAFLGLQFGLGEKAKDNTIRLNNTRVALEAIAKVSSTDRNTADELHKRLL